MTSKHSPSTPNMHTGDEIIQPNGLSIPFLTDLSAFDVEFFSDEEDDTCIVVDPIVQASDGEDLVETSALTRSLKEPTDLPSLSESKYVNISTSTVQTEQESAMVQTESTVMQSIDTQTITEKVASISSMHQASNTNTITFSDCEVQTEPIKIAPEESELSDSLIVHCSEKKSSSALVKAIPTSLSSPLPPPDHIHSFAKMESKPADPTASTDLSNMKESSSSNNNNPLKGGIDVVGLIDPQEMKISFLEFNVGDIALFVPIDEKKEHWMAFHSNRPYRFLAQESLEIFLAKDRQRSKAGLSNQSFPKERSRILGRIILIDTHTATKEDNPHQLPLGTDYYLCYVEPLLVPKKKEHRK